MLLPLQVLFDPSKDLRDSSVSKLRRASENEERKSTCKSHFAFSVSHCRLSFSQIRCCSSTRTFATAFSTLYGGSSTVHRG